MGKKEKLQSRLISMPKDFTYDELKSLLEALGFEISNLGKTSGSRVRFMKGCLSIIIHKPHPRNTLLQYQMKQVLDILMREGLL